MESIRDLDLLAQKKKLKHPTKKQNTQSPVLISSNPFQLPPGIKPLEDMDHEEPTKKEPRPPLIYVEEVKDFVLLRRELGKRIGKTSP